MGPVALYPLVSQSLPICRVWKDQGKFMHSLLTEKRDKETVNPVGETCEATGCSIIARILDLEDQHSLGTSKDNAIHPRGVTPSSQHSLSTEGVWSCQGTGHPLAMVIKPPSRRYWRAGKKRTKSTRL